MDCNTCKNVYHVDPVPYIVHESAMARNERNLRRLLCGLLIALGLLVLSNVCWLWAWTSYDYTGEESYVDLDAKDGVVSYVGNDGSINYGEDTSTYSTQDTH